MTQTRTIPVAAPVKVQAKTTEVRIAAIDIVRAITMVLMIFVNDLGSLKNIPLWLEHVERGVDGIGLADVVFPAFLFIVGLSLPFAVTYRRKKGDSDLELVKHILSRTAALLIMGVFLVNGETINAAATGIPPYLWNPACCLSFILIWNVYPIRLGRWPAMALRLIGIVTLMVLAVIYRGGDDGTHRFAPQWWGILGLIGWAYLVSALITVFSRDRFIPLLSGWIFFCILSMVYKAHLLPRDSFLSAVPEAVLGGTLTGLTMGGVVAAYVFRHYQGLGKNVRLTMIFLASAAALIALSVITRPYWGLAKLGATPAWLFLCSAFTLLAFTVVYWIADIGGKSKWFNIIRPAGTDTLLCYLIPYFIIFIRRIFGIRFPEFMLSGGVGLLKSFLLALLCVWITRGLNRSGVKLKL